MDYSGAPHFLRLRHIPRHVVHTSVRSLSPLPPLPSGSPYLDPRTNVRKPGSFFHQNPLARASRLSTLFLRLDPYYYDELYATLRAPPSLLAGLLNGYNLALFTTRAARSPVWQVSPRRSFLWEANRRRSLSSPASKSKIILSLGFLTAAINPFERAS